MNTFVYKYTCCSHSASYTHARQQDSSVAPAELLEACDHLTDTSLSYVSSNANLNVNINLLSPIGWEIAMEPPLQDWDQVYRLLVNDL